MSAKCISIYNNQSFQDKLISHFYEQNYFEESLLKGNLNQFTWQLIQLIQETALNENLDLSTIDEDDVNLIKDLIYDSTSDYDGLSAIDTIVSNVLTAINSSDLQARLSDALNPIKNEEATYASSFLVEKIGNGFESKVFQKEVADKLFELTIWDKKSFVTSCAQIQKNLKDYRKQLESELGQDYETKKIQFLNLLDKFDLAKEFENASDNILNSGISFSDFKKFFQLAYLDDFINLNLSGFIDVNKQYYNIFDEGISNKYSYASENKTEFLGEDEFVDLNTNTEKIIKLFIENFSLYSYKTGLPLNQKFALNSWQEANSQIKYLSKSYENVDINTSTQYGTLVDYLISVNTINGNIPNADKILLDELKTFKNFKVSYLVQSEKHSTFYIKYFLQILMKDGNTINPSKIAIDSKQTKVQTLVSDNKLNYVYSLYRNLFDTKDSIYSSDLNIEKYSMDYPQYLASLCQNLLTNGTVEMCEIINNQGAPELVNIKDKQYYTARRDLEKHINQVNLNSVNSNISFSDFIKSIDENIKIVEHSDADKNTEFIYKESLGNKEKIYCQLQFGDDKVKFCFTQGDSEADWKKLSENSSFQKLVEDLLHVDYYSNVTFRNAINADVNNNLPTLATLCFDILAAQYSRREHQELPREIQYGEIYGTSNKASITRNRTSLLQQISNINSAVQGKEDLTISKDINKNSVSSVVLGNLAGSPMCFPSSSRQDLTNPTSEFKLTSPDTCFEVKNIRDYQNEDGEGILWGKTSSSDMFTHLFLQEYIGGFLDTKDFSYNITNGKRIGAPTCVNSDKPLFGQGFINTDAKIFNGKTIDKASTEDIYASFRDDMQSYYKKLLEKLKENYNRDVANCNATLGTSFKLIDTNNESIDNWYSTLVEFYSNSDIIRDYNLSLNRTTPIIEANNVFHTKLNKRLLADFAKFNDDESFKTSIELGNLFFAHTLLTNDTTIPQTALSEKDRITEKLKSLQGNHKYAFDLVSVNQVDYKTFAKITIPSNFNSFYDSSLNYIISRDLAKSIYENSNITKQGNFKIDFEDDNRKIKSFNIDASLLSKFICHKSDSYAPIAKVQYSDNKGNTYHKVLSSSEDFYQFVDHLSKVKNYKAAQELFEKPLNTYSPELNVKLTINPVLAKYNAFATFMQQEYILTQDGSNLAHKAAGNPDENRFIEEYPFLENSLIENNSKLQLVKKIAQHDIEMGFADKTQQKRNNQNTAQMKLLNTDVIDGMNKTYKVAIIEDPKTLGFSPNGTSGTIKILDGCTFISSTCARAINKSLCASKVGLETMKLYSAQYKDEYGIGSNNKTANFTLTNEKIRQDEFYQRMAFNMMKHTWRKQDNTIFTPEDLFKSSLNGDVLLSDQIPFYYKLNDKYYGRAYVGKDSNGQYKFKDFEVDKHGNTLNEGPEFSLTITDNFELYLALGGWNSCSLQNGELKYSDWSQDKLFEIQVSITENNNAGKYKCEVFQPLLASDIFMVLTEGAVKMTHTNIMPKDCLFESIYNEDGSFKSQSFYNYSNQDSRKLGPQLDKTHHADRSQIANMTQVISACIAQGYTPNQALAVYEALGTLSKLATKEFRNTNTSQIKNLDENINNTIFNTLCKYIIKNKESELDTNLEILTRDIIKEVQKNQQYDCSELANKIPLDSTTIYKKVISILGSTLTKLGIRLKVTGNLAVINPTEEVVKYYKIPYSLPTNFSEEWINNFTNICEAFPQVSSKRIYNYLINNENVQINNITEEDLLSTSPTIKYQVCRSSRIPGIRKNNSTVLYKNDFINKVLSKLSDTVQSTSDINIGSNYKITITSPEDINTFKLKTSEEQQKLLEVQEIKDSNGNTLSISFWANVGLPHYQIYKNKKHFVGQHYVKALISKLESAKVEKIYDKGLDLDFQNVNFKDSEGNNFELTDLFTVQLYCQLSSLKKNDLDRFNYYSYLIQQYNSEFSNYLNYYLNNELNYKKEKEENVSTFANDVIKAIKDFSNNTTDFSNFFQSIDLDSIITNTFKQHYPDNILTEELKNKYKTTINEIFLEICDKFLYKKHQDDLHALSKNSTLSASNTEVIIVDGYSDLNWQKQSYKKVTVNKNSIKNKVCGVIMPKTFRSVLHLDNDDTVQDILNDKQYFTKQLLKRNNCTLVNVVSNYILKEQKEISTSLWDLCLKTLDGTQLYIKTKTSKDACQYFETQQSRFKPISSIYKDGEGKFWAKNISSGKVIAQVYNENDIIYYDNISKNYIILTEGATLIDKEGKPTSLTDLNNFTESGLTIQKNPFDFYLSTFNFNTFAINTEESTYDTLTANSLTWNLLDKALSSNAKVNKYYSELSSNFDEKLKELDWLRDNKGELCNNSLIELFQKQGKLLHQSFNKILDIIAARIPAQCLQSVMAMRVADFIESDSSQALVSAYQFYLQGSDLDIDSVSLQTFSLNDNGEFQSHTPYYNLDLDEASQLLPFKPEIKEISFNENGISAKNLIDKYGAQLNNKDNFYIILEELGYEALVNRMFYIRDYFRDTVDEFNNQNNTNFNYCELNGFKYPIYKKGIPHNEPHSVIAAVTVAELYFRNMGDTENLELLKEAKRKYYNKVFPNSCFELNGNKIELVLETEDQMKTFAKFLNEFSESQTLLKNDSTYAQQLLKIINNHFQYYHKLSERNKAYAALNYEFNNLRSITLDTSHMSEALASIDVIITPVKDNADTQKQATRGWYSTTTNCMNVPLGIEVNMTGKEDIAICAVAEKHYFALQGAFQAVLNSNDEELKKMLIAGLGWAFDSEEEKEKALKNTKVANKYCTIISNAFDARLTGDFVKGETTIQLLKSEQESIDKLLKQLVQSQSYNKNAALIISALLTLSTDNAKELVLGKINAGTATIDLYLVGAVAGFSINELMTIINSDYGQEISKLLTSNYYSGKRQLTSALEATQLFEKIPQYVQTAFKNKSIDLYGYIQEGCQPEYVINQIIANNLFLVFGPEGKLKDELIKIKESKDSKESPIKLDHLSKEDQKLYKEWQYNPINKVFEIIYNNQVDEATAKENYKLQGLIQKYAHSFNLKSWEDSFNQSFIKKLKETINILKNSSDSTEDQLNTLIEFKLLLQKIPNLEFKEFLEKTRYQIPQDDVKRRVYRDIYRIIKDLRTTSLNKAVSNRPMNYQLYLGNPKYDATQNVLDMAEIFKEDMSGKSLKQIAVNNKLKLRTNQIWDTWLQRIRGCSLKYSKNNLGGDAFRGYYSIPKAFNKLALRAKEFSIGSRLLINKEVPTKQEDINNMINRFELVFKTQLSLYDSLEKFENSKYKNWVHACNSKSKDSFTSQYIVFNEDGVPLEGIRMNIRNFLYDESYRKNCLKLMDELKIFINILVAPSQLPHYRSYIETLLALKTCQEVTLTSLVDRFFTIPLIEERGTKAPFTEGMHKQTYALMENISITSFLKSLNLSGKFKAGVSLESGVLQNDEDFDISTEKGQKQFIYYFEQKVKNLQQKFPENLFIKKLMQKDVIYTLHGNTITPYTEDINMTPKKNSEGENKLLNQCKMHYLNLNKNNFSLNNLNEIFGDFELNTNLSLADMFYIYSLLTTGNQASSVSLSQLVNIQLSQPGSIAEQYMHYQAKFNQDIIDEYNKVVDKETGNINFNQAVKLRKYILTLQANSNLIVPKLFRNDNAKAGTDIILRDGIFVEYYKTKVESNSSNEDYNENQDYQDEDYNDEILQDVGDFDTDYDGPQRKIHPKSNREFIKKITDTLIYGAPVSIDLESDLQSSVSIEKDSDSEVVKITLENYIIADEWKKLISKYNAKNLISSTRNLKGSYIIYINEHFNSEDDKKDAVECRLALFKLILNKELTRAQKTQMHKIFKDTIECPITTIFTQDNINALKTALNDEDFKDKLNGFGCN